MKKKTIRILDKAINSSVIDSYVMKVTLENGDESEVRSQGFTKSNAKSQAIMTADLMFGADSYEIKSFEKL